MKKVDANTRIFIIVTKFYKEKNTYHIDNFVLNFKEHGNFILNLQNRYKYELGINYYYINNYILHVLIFF